jgi:hypothetical protein
MRAYLLRAVAAWLVVAVGFGVYANRVLRRQHRDD